MESNEATELTGKIETDPSIESRMTGKGGYGVEGLSKKEKGLMDMDNSVVIIGGGECKGAKWSWKKYN